MGGSDAWPVTFSWLLQASWQGSIVIGLVLIVQTCFGRWLKPAVRYGLWWFVLIRLALPFSLGSPTSIFNLAASSPLAKWTNSAVPPGSGAGSLRVPFPAQNRPVFTSTEADPDHATADPAFTEAPKRATAQARRFWSTLLSSMPLLWMLGALLLTARVVWAVTVAAARVRKRRPISDVALLGLLDECGKTARVISAPWIVEAPEIRTPALFGVLVPYLLLPPGLVGVYSREELRLILLHELFHVRRRDVVLNWLITTLQILHWFNPLVWIAFRMLRSDREIACDAAVLSQIPPEESRLYGQTIIRLLERFSAPPGLPNLVGLLEGRSEMKRRIGAIASHAAVKSTSPLVAAVVLPALALAALTDAKTPVLPPIVVGAGLGLTRTIKVVDADTNQPIEGASANGVATTGADGICRLQATAPASILVRAWGYVPERSFFRRDDGDSLDLVFKMRRARTIGGTVRDERGEPVSGVEVRVLILTSGAANAFNEIGSPFGGFSFKTDHEGRWECSEAPPEWRGLTLTLAHPDLVEDVYAAGTLSPPYDNTREPLRFVSPGLLFDRSAVMAMRRGIPVRGRVLDAQGRPIAGAEVREGRTFFYGPHERMTTDAAGRYCFKNLASGKVALTVLAPGYAFQTKLVAVRPGLGETPFILEKGRPLRGRVTTDQGQPIVGAWIWATTAPPSLDWNTKTGQDGSFTWDSAPAGPVQIGIGAPGFIQKSRIWLRPGDVVHQIVLQEEPRVEGTVVDARSGQPIPKFRVLTSVTAFPNGAVEYMWTGAGRAGRFSVPIQRVHRTYEVGGPPGAPAEGVRVRIEADGYHPADSPFLFPQTGETVADFAMRRLEPR
jgi:beta-lactamase regulating signal transducer with metallopeptidase domain